MLIQTALGSAKHKTDFGITEDTKAQVPKRGKFDGLSRKQKRRKIATEEDSKEMVSQKAAARSSKSGMKPKKLLQISESTRKDKPIRKTTSKQGSFDKESDNRKKPSSAIHSVKEKTSRIKFKTKNKSKSRHKKRR